MTQFADAKPTGHWSAKLAAGFALSALLALGSFAAPASAQYYRGYHNWNGGYYAAPPVVYGSPYDGGYYGSPYYAPPAVYGPGIGISLPGINIGIR
jgi:hypothetical protein